jgi:signal transduction histidine kinase
VHGLATGRGVPVRVQLPDPEGGDGEPIVLGDPGLLAVMVENLVRNAVRLTEEGSPVHVVLAPGDGRALRLSVTDRGPGISQDTIDLMHDGEAAERRVESPRVKGTILSLSIASQIAKLHAGRIEAGNTDEGGARVTVWLPRAGDQVQPGGGSKPGPAAAGDASAS